MTLSTGLLVIYLSISSLILPFTQHEKRVTCYENKILGLAFKTEDEQFSFMYSTFAMGELHTRIEKGILEKALSGNVLLEAKTVSFFRDFKQTEEEVELPTDYVKMIIRLEKREAQLLDSQNNVLKKCPCQKSLFNKFD